MAASKRPAVRMNGKLIRYVECQVPCYKVMNVVRWIRPVLKSEWCMKKRTVRMMYKSLFVVCVMYGSCVWCEYMRSNYAREIMNKYQRLVQYTC